MDETQYQAWIRRFGDSIRDDGPRMAAMLAGKPIAFAERYIREAHARKAKAKQMGGVSEFYFPEKS